MARETISRREQPDRPVVLRAGVPAQTGSPAPGTGSAWLRRYEHYDHLMDSIAEVWLDKRGLAAHLSCSVRSIQTALAEGMPHAVIFGRVKFRVSEVEPWLEERGYLRRSDENDSARQRVNAGGP